MDKLEKEVADIIWGINNGEAECKQKANQIIPIIKKAVAEEIMEWGDTFCVKGKEHGRPTNYANVRKRECRLCWQSLKREKRKKPPLEGK